MSFNIFGFLYTLRCLKTPSAKAIVTHQYEGLKIKCDNNFEYNSNPLESTSAANRRTAQSGYWHQ